MVCGRQIGSRGRINDRTNEDSRLTRLWHGTRMGLWTDLCWRCGMSLRLEMWLMCLSQVKWRRRRRIKVRLCFCHTVMGVAWAAGVGHGCVVGFSGSAWHHSHKMWSDDWLMSGCARLKSTANCFDMRASGSGWPNLSVCWYKQMVFVAMWSASWLTICKQSWYLVQVPVKVWLRSSTEAVGHFGVSGVSCGGVCRWNVVQGSLSDFGLLLGVRQRKWIDCNVILCKRIKTSKCHKQSHMSLRYCATWYLTPMFEVPKCLGSLVRLWCQRGVSHDVYHSHIPKEDL